MANKVETDKKLFRYTEVGKSSAPCLLIGRLGVDSRFRNTHLGSYILEWTEGLVEQNKAVGIRFISLHCDRRNPAVNFYRHHGFRVIYKFPGRSTDLLLVSDQYGPGPDEIDY